MNRESINQFIREDDRRALPIIPSTSAPRGRGGRNNGRRRRSFLCILPKTNIFNPILKSRIKLRRFLPCPSIYSFCQLPTSCTLLHYYKSSWPTQFFPHLPQLPPHTMCKKAGENGTGIVIVLPSHLRCTRHIVTIAGFIQCDPHIFGEGDGSFLLDSLDNQCLQRSCCHLPLPRSASFGLLSLPNCTTSKSNAISGVRRLRLSAASVSSN